MKIVEVIWLDAGCEHETLDIEDASKVRPMPRKNVGYLVGDDGDKLNMCFGTIEDVDKKMMCVSDTLTIPRSTVKSIKVLDQIE